MAGSVFSFSNCLFVCSDATTNAYKPLLFQTFLTINGHFQHSFSLVLAPFRRRAPISRESGSFSFSKLFFSTNHCTARGIFSLNLLPFLCLRSDWHEIRNLSFFRRAACNRGVISVFCLFVCLLSWTQLNCFLIDFDFLSGQSNERWFCVNLFQIFKASPLHRGKKVVELDLDLLEITQIAKMCAHCLERSPLALWGSTEHWVTVPKCALTVDFDFLSLPFSQTNDDF
jgi:hypothetical protein